MKLQKSILIVFLTLILLLSVIVGRFLAPLGILLSPVAIVIMAGLILFTDNGFGILVKSVLCYLYIGLNDIGLKLFAGGIHDIEGEGFMTLFFLTGLIICFIMLLVAVYKRQEPNQEQGLNKWIKIVSILGFILLVCAHIALFQELGLDARYR